MARGVVSVIDVAFHVFLTDSACLRSWKALFIASEIDIIISGLGSNPIMLTFERDCGILGTTNLDLRLITYILTSVHYLGGAMKKMAIKVLGWLVLLNLLVCVILNAIWQDLTYYQRDSDFSNLQIVLDIQENMPWLPWVYYKPGSGHEGYWTWFGFSSDIQATHASFKKTDNPFFAGDLVCVDSESGVKDSLPAITIVLGTDGDLMHLVGHEGMVHYLHYQNCW